MIRGTSTLRLKSQKVFVSSKSYFAVYIFMELFFSIAFLVYNNISNGERLQCQRGNENSPVGNNFSNLFANVLGSENPNKQNAAICDNSLIINLLKLSSHMVLTEMPRQPSVCSRTKRYETYHICIFSL